MARAIKQTRTTLKIKRDTGLYDTGFSSQDQMSPETDVVIGPDTGIQLLGNMLRHEL